MIVVLVIGVDLVQYQKIDRNSDLRMVGRSYLFDGYKLRVFRGKRRLN